MPFKKGHSGNPKGMIPRQALAVRWDLIDQYVNQATKCAMLIIDGTDVEFKKIEDPEKRVDLRLKAIGHILKLAPERHAGPNGESLFHEIEPQQLERFLARHGKGKTV